jgi:hypothetical protein
MIRKIPGSVYSATVSDNGKYLAFGGGSKYLFLFDISSMKPSDEHMAESMELA